MQQRRNFIFAVTACGTVSVNEGYTLQRWSSSAWFKKSRRAPIG